MIAKPYAWLDLILKQYFWWIQMPMYNNLEYKLIKPDKSLSHFVESFWLLRNQSDTDKEIVVLPDGRVDLTFSQSAIAGFSHYTLRT